LGPIRQQDRSLNIALKYNVAGGADDLADGIGPIGAVNKKATEP
jgi:hypothetical protein